MRGTEVDAVTASYAQGVRDEKIRVAEDIALVTLERDNWRKRAESKMAVWRETLEKCVETGDATLKELDEWDAAVATVMAVEVAHEWTNKERHRAALSAARELLGGAGPVEDAAPLREAIEKRLHATEAIGDVPQAIGERYGYEWVLAQIDALSRSPSTVTVRGEAVDVADPDPPVSETTHG